MFDFYILLSIALMVLFVVSLRLEFTKKDSKAKKILLGSVVPVLSLVLAFYFFVSGAAYKTVLKGVEKDLTSFETAYQKGKNQSAEKVLEERNKKVKSFVKDEEQVNNAPVFGNPEGSKVIYVFADYNCGYCKKAHEELKKVIAQDSDVKVVMKNLPILNPISEILAKASVAASMQGKSVEMDDAIFNANVMDALKTAVEGKKNASQQDLEKVIDEVIEGIANKAGVDFKKLKSDMESKAVQEELMRTEKAAREDFGIKGTPALIIKDKFFGGYIPSSKIIEELK